MKTPSKLVRLLAKSGKSSKPLRCPACKKAIQEFRCQYCGRDYHKAANLNLLLNVSLVIAALFLGLLTACYFLLRM